MRETVALFRKDVRRFRMQLAGLLGLMAIFGWMDAVLPRRREFQAFPFFFELLFLIAGWYLTVMVVHQEALPGDRQYWITRPISWARLLLAKLLFVVVFLNLPVFVCNLAALLVNGLSPAGYLGPLMARQAFLLCFVVLPAMALASVTRDLGQFAIAIFAAFGIVLAIGLQSSDFLMNADWGGFAWIRATAIAILAAIVCGAVLLWQYARRRTMTAGAILAAGVIALGAAPGVNLWYAAFRFQRSLKPPSSAADTVRLSADLDRDPAPARGVLGFWHGTGGYVRLVLPVRIAGIPKDMALLSERIAARLDLPGGDSWNGSWSNAGGTFQLSGPQHLLSADGAYWQYFYVNRGLYNRIKSTPVRLRTSAAFTLLSPPATTRVTPPTVARPVPEFGFCATRAVSAGLSNMINGAVTVICLAPFQEHVEWAALSVQSRGTGRIEALGAPREFSYGPYPADLGANVWSMLGDVKPVYNPADLDILLEGRHAAAWLQRDLDLPGVRLIRYEDSSVGGRP